MASIFRKLSVICILVMGLSLTGCGRNENEELEKERQQLNEERFNLLDEMKSELEGEWISLREGPEGDFWWFLNKKQQGALLELEAALDGDASKGSRLTCINRMAKLLTPGMLIELAELTKTREDILRENHEVFAKVERYKERAASYYRQLWWDAEYKYREERANWFQAEKYYHQIKEQVFHKELPFGELLYDLRNARVSGESVWEPRGNEEP
jgi:hypothetical protein